MEASQSFPTITNCAPLLSSFSTFLHLAASSCHNFLLFSTKWPDAWTPEADLWRLSFMGQYHRVLTIPNDT